MRINSKEELQSKKAEIEQNIQSFTWLPVLRKSMMRW